MKTKMLPTLLFILTGFLSPMSQANSLSNTPSYSESYANIQLAQNTHQSLSDAAESIKQQTGGRILSAKTVNKNGQQVHKIKVLMPSGKVRVFEVNAQ